MAAGSPDDEQRRACMTVHTTRSAGLSGGKVTPRPWAQSTSNRRPLVEPPGSVTVAFIAPGRPASGVTARRVCGGSAVTTTVQGAHRDDRRRERRGSGDGGDRVQHR